MNGCDFESTQAEGLTFYGMLSGCGIVIAWLVCRKVGRWVETCKHNNFFCLCPPACRPSLWMEITWAPCLRSWEACLSSTAWVSPSTASPTSPLCWRGWVPWTSWPWLGTGWRVWSWRPWPEWATWRTSTYGEELAWKRLSVLPALSLCLIFFYLCLLIQEEIRCLYASSYPDHQYPSTQEYIANITMEM